jgi:hypothetical protein
MTVRKRMGTIGLSGRARPEGASEISDITAKLKEAGAQWYSAQRRMVSTETVGGTPAGAVRNTSRDAHLSVVHKQ